MDLTSFNNKSLFDATVDLFAQLGIKLNSNTTAPLPAKDILRQHYKYQAIFGTIEKVFFVGLIEDNIFPEMSLFEGAYSLLDALAQANHKYEGLMLFALELNEHPNRKDISDLTRAFNRVSQKMPVAILLKYNDSDQIYISLSISERFAYKQNWREGEKVGKVIILRDVKTINTHAGHQRILLDLVKPAGVYTYDDLHHHWLQVFDVSILNKKFYEELFKWFLWAVKNVRFPQIRPAEDLIKDEAHQTESVIRLLTRLLFCWFLKEKQQLIPELDRFESKY